MLNCLIKRNHNLAVVFLDETTSEDEVLLAELEKIDGETKKYDIDFVKVEKSLYSFLLMPFQCYTNLMKSCFLHKLYLCSFHLQVEDNDEAADYGISLLPALVYFENRIPSLYDADLAKVRLLDLSITIQQIT